MSGGSMNYFYQNLEDAADRFRTDTLKRRALRKHLLQLAKLMKAVEWNDSGDGDDEEDALMETIISPALLLDKAIEEAKEARRDLQLAIERAK